MSYTLQSLFDASVLGVWHQGGAARAEGGSCRYRVGSRRCAIGHLIPNDAYDASIEGKSLCALANAVRAKPDMPMYHRLSQVPWIVDGRALGLLRQLQRAHDHLPIYALSSDEGFLRWWEKACRAIAADFDLRMPDLDVSAHSADKARETVADIMRAALIAAEVSNSAGIPQLSPADLVTV